MLGTMMRLRDRLDRIDPVALIQVDDGMTLKTLPLAYQSGARASGEK